jgi:asparagine synthase (glutamine-hydrolysing)
MCGIAGIFSIDGNFHNAENKVQRMLYSMIHRGPDDKGVLVDKNVCLGHRRLSIIGLEGGRQPLSNEDGSVWVTFNGEIYNYQDIRKDLIKKGHTFKTNTDTEVLVHLYEEYGMDFVPKLNGMFAFAIWDSNNGILSIARDRLGVKPLYYAWINNTFYFASELKALWVVMDADLDINLNALYNYMSYKYTPVSDSIFTQIKKLTPGCYMRCQSKRNEPVEYWHPGSVQKENENIQNVLYNATKIRLMSEVPLAASLSGGIDSGVLIRNMQLAGVDPIHAFTARFSGSSVDESELASETARKFNCKHKIVDICATDVSILEDIAWYLDEPFSDYSALPTYLISKEQKKIATVILSGDGGDEAFGGYDRYRIMKYLSLLSKSQLSKLIKIPLRLTNKYHMFQKIQKVMSTSLELPGSQYDKLVGTFDKQQKKEIFSKDVLAEINASSISPIEEIFLDSPTGVDPYSYIDYRSYLPGDVLHKVDRMSMAASVEVRSPFLDYNVVEFGLSLNSRDRYNFSKGKVSLRSSYKDILPNNVVKGKKKGFSAPLDQWLSGDFSSYVQDTLRSGKARNRGYFNYDIVNNMLDDMYKNKTYDLKRIWSLLMLEIWHQTFVDNKKRM